MLVSPSMGVGFDQHGVPRVQMAHVRAISTTHVGTEGSGAVGEEICFAGRAGIAAHRLFPSDWLFTTSNFALNWAVPQQLGTRSATPADAHEARAWGCGGALASASTARVSRADGVPGGVNAAAD
jgi:hypothetical protein